MSPITNCIKNKDTKINPIWLMRQAGRYLPEFREIRKENQNFIKLCLNSNLASEITLQPIKRFGFDGAVIFSDILMLPYGIGQKVEFEKNFEVEAIRDILQNSPGIIVQDDPQTQTYPMPIYAEGKDEVFVGRIRRDTSHPNALNLWIVADNLRKGAATNTVQIAEYLIANQLV